VRLEIAEANATLGFTQDLFAEFESQVDGYAFAEARTILEQAMRSQGM